MINKYISLTSIFISPPPRRSICLSSEADDLSDSYQSGNEENALVSRADDEINGNWVPAPVGTVHEARLKAKAKRRLRKNSSRDSGRGDSLSENGEASRSAVPPASPKGKVLDRRSRLGKGRGLPKKGERDVSGLFCLRPRSVLLKGVDGMVALHCRSALSPA